MELSKLIQLITKLNGTLKAEGQRFPNGHRKELSKYYILAN